LVYDDRVLKLVTHANVWHQQKMVKLLLLLCPDDQFGSLDPKLCDEIKAFGPCEIVKVPKHAPRYMEEFREWNQMWPISYRPRPPSPPPAVSEESKMALVAHMKAAIEQARIAKASSHLPIGCVIVDPKRNCVMASAHDERETGGGGHPLHHAVMRCIAKVAETDLKTWPKEPSRKRSLGEDQGTKNKPYLCNGYDLFVTHEPCVMCAMASLHSRIGRVFWCVKNTYAEQSGLGGDYMLHKDSRLNHRFKVFRGLLEDEAKRILSDNSNTVPPSLDKLAS